MQLTVHQYMQKPWRYFIDGKRVSKERYEQEQVFSNMKGKQASSFLTTRITNEHYKHTHCIN